MSRFSEVPLGLPIEVLALREAFAENPSENKIDLGLGTYRTRNGEPFVLPVVRQVEQAMARDDTLNKEYISFLGLRSFTKAAAKMLFSADSPALLENRTLSVQVLSSTGGLHLGASFLRRTLGYKIFYYSNPPCQNHYKLVFTSAGFEDAKTYRYWCQSTCSLDINGLLEDIGNATRNSVIILQSCAHVPTGCDPTQDQWKHIFNVIKKRQLFPFIDSSNLGIASGNVDTDAWPVRYLVSQGVEFMCLQSFAKNFGLYNERVGNLTVVMNDNSCIARIKSQIASLIRGSYGNPPCHGARVVAYILNNRLLYEEWKDSLREMCCHIVEMRKALRDSLERITTPGTWDHITSQIGMFCFSGLNEEQSAIMARKHHIYMLKSGRINMCGINYQNVEYVAKAIQDSIINPEKEGCVW